MTEKELIIVGGGPAGLCAAKMALEAGAKVMLVDRNKFPGGQLVKQTHKFFGSEKQYAKTRGFDIARILLSDLGKQDDLEILTDTTAVGFYKDHVLTTLHDDKEYHKYHAKAYVMATGAAEKFLAFENNDLPGITGAGAVQTLMNLYGVLPGKEVVMVGSGNIGLIVSYQLLQAGVSVKAILEAAPNIGGYKVHAAKIARLGVPILTSTTVKKAFGTKELEKIETVSLDENWKEIPGTEKQIFCDTLCIAVGLSPLHQLMSMAGIRMKYVNELGGLVPVLDGKRETSMENVFACGDVSGIEEASSAMAGGSLAGLYAANAIGHRHKDFDELTRKYEQELCELRQGPCGKKIRTGLERLVDADATE